MCFRQSQGCQLYPEHQCPRTEIRSLAYGSTSSLSRDFQLRVTCKKRTDFPPYKIIGCWNQEGHYKMIWSNFLILQRRPTKPRDVKVLPQIPQMDSSRSQTRTWIFFNLHIGIGYTAMLPRLPSTYLSLHSKTNNF